MFDVSMPALAHASVAYPCFLTGGKASKGSTSRVAPPPDRSMGVVIADFLSKRNDQWLFQVFVSFWGSILPAWCRQIDLHRGDGSVLFCHLLPCLAF